MTLWKTAWIALAAACGPRPLDPPRALSGVAMPQSSPGRPAEVAAIPQAPDWYFERSSFDGPALLESPTTAWELRLTGPVIHPLTTDGATVYAVADGTLTRIGLDGDVAWSEPLGASGGAAPTQRGPAVGTQTGAVAIVDSDDGSVVVQISSGDPVRGRPVRVSDGLAWVTVQGLVVAEANWTVDDAISSGGGAASDGQSLYFSTLEGDLFAVGAARRLWRANIPGPGLGRPVVGDGVVFAAFGATPGRHGGVAAVARDEGTLLWVWRAEHQIGAPPALGGLLLVPLQSGELVALEPSTGAVAWTAMGGASFSVTPAVVGSNAYAGTGDGMLTRFDLADGGEAWTTDLGSPVTGDPVAVQGLVVVGLADGRVVALGVGS